jgi:hypothetical protein
MGIDVELSDRELTYLHAALHCYQRRIEANLLPEAMNPEADAYEDLLMVEHLRRRLAPAGG